MQAPATTAKEEVIEMLRRLPDDASFEDIEYHVSVITAVHRGIRDMEEGRTVTHEEMVRLMAEWRDP